MRRWASIDRYERANSVLVSEVNTILDDHGLLEILGKCSKPIVQRSYALSLMVWRDFNIRLEFEHVDVKFLNTSIYKAVIEDNVRSIEEFVEWLEKQR